MSTVGGDFLESKVEFFVCTMGTRGDILPFLALAKALIAHGHKVVILTNANWKGLVEGIGAQFHGIADADPPQSGRDDLEFYRRQVYPSFGASFDFIARQQAGRRCAVVHRLNMLGAECAAEKFRLPAVKVVLQPSLIRSAERPPWPLTGLAYGKFAAISKKLVIPVFYRIGEMAGPYRRYSNHFRASVGLRSLGRGTRREDLMLILCPDWFAMPQKDWPSRSRTVGFVYHDAPYDDAELARFIDRFGRPLVFTPGTGVTDVDAFFSGAAAVCEKLKLPGIFLSPSAEGRQYSPNIAVRAFTELHWLLPRARMLVHHGGIGSTAQAIRAGVPQIVLPGRFDQPDNALRTAILGLGGAVLSRASTDDLANLVSQVLADGAVRDQVAVAARLVRRQKALERATDLVMQVAGRHFDGASQWRIPA